MKFGVCCTPLDRAAAVKAAGFDYVEASVQELLQGERADAEWDGELRASSSPLPIATAFLLVPGPMKIVGPHVSLPRLGEYIARVTRRAKRLNIGILGFGSGGARNVPDGFSRDRAMTQLIDFARVAARAAQEAGVVIAMEPLNRPECNFINRIEEVAAVVNAVNSPHFRALFDTYHFWMEREPIANAVAAAPLIGHVHVGDLKDRTPPGESGTSDYRPIFALLKRAGYDGMISVEAASFDVESGTRSAEFLKRQWNES